MPPNQLNVSYSISLHFTIENSHHSSSASSSDSSTGMHIIKPLFQYHLDSVLCISSSINAKLWIIRFRIRNSSMYKRVMCIYIPIYYQFYVLPWHLYSHPNIPQHISTPYDPLSPLSLNLDPLVSPFHHIQFTDLKLSFLLQTFFPRNSLIISVSNLPVSAVVVYCLVASNFHLTLRNRWPELSIHSFPQNPLASISQILFSIPPQILNAHGECQCPWSRILQYSTPVCTIYILNG